MRRAACILLLAASVLAGCSDRGTEGAGPTAPGTDPVSYAADVQPLWNAQCVGCHGAGGNGGLDLRAPDSRAALVGVASVNWPGALVTAGEPDASVLYLKLVGAPGVGARMPQGGALGADALETVRRWIAEGALDN
jgi:hypothetical protein